MSSLEQTLEPRHRSEALIADVEAWTLRLSTENSTPEERIEKITGDLKERLGRIKPEIERARFGGPALARELADLKDAYERAIASIPAERRAAEYAMAETMEGLEGRLKEFRLDVSSFSVQSNGEVRRRLAQLELGRRQAADTMSEIRRAPSERWAILRRRWEAQIEAWGNDHRDATERLSVIRDTMPAPREKMDVE